jgi:hypothetical protein
MPYRLAADGVLLAHLAFIAFVMLGALLALKWPWAAAMHVPAVAWATFVELTGRICPLTFIENHFRTSAGLAGYGDSFIEHYLLRVIYPGGLTSSTQLALAIVVIVVNAGIYAWVLLHLRRMRPADA